MIDDRNTLPLIAGVAGGSLLLWSLLGRRQSATSTTPAPETTAASSARPAPTGWQWPIPLWGAYSPTVSDGWGSSRTTLDGTSRTHRGVDLMYPRRSVDDQAVVFPRDTPGGSKWHFMPTETPVLSARAGKVIYADRTARGHAVVIKHADRWSTFYQHLSTLRVRRGDVVTTGQILGEVGGDPTQRNPLRHLHFEIRRPDGGAIDPQPLLLTWPRVRPLALLDGVIATALLPPPRHA